MHVTTGQHSLFQQQLTPRLQQVIKGIQRCQATSNPPRIRKPITLDIMKAIFSLLSKRPPSHDNIMIWAACCAAFFGFLRCSEMTVPSQDAYDPTIHLSVGDVAVDSRSSPTMVRIRLKQSKTDPFRQGADIYLGKTDKDICPVTAILPYLAMRGDSSGPLFVLQDGRSLTRDIFSKTLDSLLKDLQLNCKVFNTHSFRSGAATSAKAANISDTHIQMLGRWKSSAYKLYIQTPPQELATLSRILAAGPQ